MTLQKGSRQRVPDTRFIPARMALPFWDHGQDLLHPWLCHRRGCNWMLWWGLLSEQWLDPYREILVNIISIQIIISNLTILIIIVQVSTLPCVACSSSTVLRPNDNTTNTNSNTNDNHYHHRHHSLFRSAYYHVRLVPHQQYCRPLSFLSCSHTPSYTVPHCSSGLLGGELPLHKSHSRNVSSVQANSQLPLSSLLLCRGHLPCWGIATKSVVASSPEEPRHLPSWFLADAERLHPLWRPGGRQQVGGGRHNDAVTNALRLASPCKPYSSGRLAIADKNEERWGEARWWLFKVTSGGHVWLWWWVGSSQPPIL